MSAATQNEMERLRSERDAMKRQLDEALEREAFLASHVERLREDVYAQADIILGEFGVRETIDDYLPESYNESASTSLARRDLIKQAEALECMSEENFISSDDLYSRAKQLRQRAAEL